jgi:hypothetical protein
MKIDLLWKYPSFSNILQPTKFFSKTRKTFLRQQLAVFSSLNKHLFIHFSTSKKRKIKIKMSWKNQKGKIDDEKKVVDIVFKPYTFKFSCLFVNVHWEKKVFS